MLRRYRKCCSRYRLRASRSLGEIVGLTVSFEIDGTLEQSAEPPSF
jgi:hypothetical protein